MSKGKKASLAQKEQRRLSEILKAQTSGRGYSPNFSVDKKTVHLETKSEKQADSFMLPISDIKKDLVKNIAFAVFSIVVLVVLNKTGFGLDHFSNVIKF